jgi:hypothetical protein
MRNIEKILNGILTLILVIIVTCQSINIKDLQGKVDYLQDEVLFTKGLVQTLDSELSYYIEKGDEK